MGIQIIGSTAIKYWFPDFNREPKDLDIVTEGKSIILEMDYPRVEKLKNPVLSEYYKGTNKYLPPDLLYTLKISHAIGWDINWDKHVWDITFLKDKGCKLDRELFEKLYNYWVELHGRNKRSDLEMTAEDFFDNAVNCPYPHDDLHLLLNAYPTYNKILKEGAEVEVCKEKFDKLSFEDKCNLVYEEVELMSWERWPRQYYKRAYKWMLKKFILNHAPLWEAVFILENYKLLQAPRRNHFKILEIGTKQYNGSNQINQ